MQRLRMRLLALLAGFLPAVALSSDLVGRIVPPYPQGLAHQQGACIAGSALGLKRSCEYSIGLLEAGSGGAVILFGARAAPRDDKGQVSWEITDSLPRPSLPAGYFLSIASCENNGNPDDSVIAVVRQADTEWLEDVLWARRYDLASEKFVEQSGATVRCANEGWGI